jgi:group I intron endonuclease
MACGIYAIFDSYNGACLYVGQSKDIQERWKAHLKGLKSGNHNRKEFIKWFNRHGGDPHALRFQILEQCENSNRIKDFLEMKWFVTLKPLFYGQIPNSLTRTWSQSSKTRQKTSESMRKLHPAMFH